MEINRRNQDTINTLLYIMVQNYKVVLLKRYRLSIFQKYDEQEGSTWDTEGED